ncbi:hypothetical protein AWN76_011200 [Rhodothermaceae bacterium RA]|nr:hypothetical protein AWN76_011200 [Rhodothermaceae bacterium RA]
MIRLPLLLLSGLLLGGCASTRLPEPPITVEGRVTMRGHAPFTALVLDTDQHNSYVLRFEGAGEASVASQAPGRFRVTGHVHRADWNGQPFAHLQVVEISKVE